MALKEQYTTLSSIEFITQISEQIQQSCTLYSHLLEDKSIILFSIPEIFTLVMPAPAHSYMGPPFLKGTQFLSIR
jgi:peroxiredoxin